MTTLIYQRAERALEQTEAALANETDIMLRLNRLFYGYLPLRKEEADFIAMLLPMMEKPEGRAMRMCYQEALAETFMPVLRRELALAQDAEVILPAAPECEDVILHLIGHCWAEVAALLLEGAKTAQKPDAAALLGILNKYRRTVERLLDAPFGSVEIIRLQEWGGVVEALSQRLIFPVQG